MSTFNDNNRLKKSRIDNNQQLQEYDELGRYRPERTRERRNVVANTTVTSTNATTPYEKYSYHQLAERLRELQKEIVPDLHRHQVSSVYSPFSTLTPCSNISGGGISNYPHRQSFSINLTSPNASVPTQRFGLSPRIVERAHHIPERFWSEWQQKQMQTQIEELEFIKNNLTSPNELTPTTRNRRQSLLLLHNTQHHVDLPQSTIDNDSSSSSSIDDHSAFSFDQRSRDDADDLKSLPIEPITPNPFVRKSQSTLDRSRLSIFLPYAHTNMSEQRISTNNYRPLSSKLMLTKANDVLPTMSAANSVEDVAQIDTELNVTLLSRENHFLLYSKATFNRTIEFRPLSSNRNKTSPSPVTYQKDTSI